jgi:hypothetical protein
MSRRTLAFACVVAAAAFLVPSSLATTRAETLNAVRVNITDSRITMARDRFERGSLAQFYIVNKTQRPQIFKVGREQTRQIRPGQHGIIIIHFGSRGRFPVQAIPNAGRRITAYYRVD